MEWILQIDIAVVSLLYVVLKLNIGHPGSKIEE